jgi:hypothetical protein
LQLLLTLDLCGLGSDIVTARDPVDRA